MALSADNSSLVRRTAAGAVHRVKSRSKRSRRADRNGRVSPAGLEEHRRALTVHCHRMLGSAVEADDAVQETMLRALRSLRGFEGRASLRTWLHRIATNVCFDALTDRSRQKRFPDAASTGMLGNSLVERPPTRWPEPDARALFDPGKLATLRESVRMALLAALHHLPPKQRAALLLTEVVGCSAAETAESLDTSVAAVHSALQRARTTLATKDLGTATRVLSRGQSWLLERYVEAFERYDVDALIELLCGDAALSTRPHVLQFREEIHVE